MAIPVVPPFEEKLVLCNDCIQLGPRRTHSGLSLVARGLFCVSYRRIGEVRAIVAKCSEELLRATY